MRWLFVLVLLVGGCDKGDSHCDASTALCANPLLAIEIEAPAKVPAATDLAVTGVLIRPDDVTALALRVGVRSALVPTVPQIPATPTSPQFASWSATIPATTFPDEGSAEIAAVAELNCGTQLNTKSIILVPAPRLAPTAVTVTAPETFALDLSTSAAAVTTCRATPASGFAISCGGLDITRAENLCSDAIEVDVTSVNPGLNVVVSCRDDLGQTAASTLSTPPPP